MRIPEGEHAQLKQRTCRLVRHHSNHRIYHDGRADGLRSSILTSNRGYVGRHDRTHVRRECDVPRRFSTL